MPATCSVSHEPVQQSLRIEDRHRSLPSAAGSAVGAATGGSGPCVHFASTSANCADLHRLGEKVVHSLANASVTVTRHRIGREGDDGNEGIAPLANPARSFVAVHHRHLAVHQDQIVSALLQRFEGFGAIGNRVGLVPEFPQLRQGYELVGRIILGEQDSRLQLHNRRATQSDRRRVSAGFDAGSTADGIAVTGGISKTAVNQKVEPSPSWLSSPILPPILSTSCLEMANPRPVPPYLRVVDTSA